MLARLQTEGGDLLAIYLPWGYSGYCRMLFIDIVTDKKMKYREYFQVKLLNIN